MRRRLDTELVRRGLLATRGQAADAIRAGRVVAAGRVAMKPSMLVDAAEPLSLSGPGRPFVSRGGEKLDGALNRFGVQVAGRDCLDAGASTGGFTDCLLSRGAARVVAVDVGYGQLAWSLREDPRVTVLERTNVRDLTADMLPFRPDLVVADLSFISIRLVLPALVGAADPEAEFVLLVKPQFEAGPEAVGKGGVVRDPAAWGAAVTEVLEACRELGAAPQAVLPSPLLGPAGNVEFFVHVASGRPERRLGLENALREGQALRGGS